MSSALSETNHHHAKQKWWKPFTKPFLIESQNHQIPTTTTTNSNSPFNKPANLSLVFGSRLQDSLQIASVAISMVGPDKKPYIYGFIPVVVAKCGLYLKEHATQTEGIFRISGSTKRIQQLQNIFSQPPFYGKDLEWSSHHPHPVTSNSNSDQTTHPILRDLDVQSPPSLKPYFSVHDAANLLRRYLMCLPEPLINQSLYEDFRQVLIKYPDDKPKQIRLFKSLISTLNPCSQYLLLYLLDLLAVFSNKSDKNLMTANNLAVLFQPALCPANPTTQDKLNRIIYAQQTPTSDQLNNNPAKFKNYQNLENQDDRSRPSIQQESLLEQESIMKRVKLAQSVVEFLILNQNHFVLGLRPQPKPNNIINPPNKQSLRASVNGNESKIDDRPNPELANDEAGQSKVTNGGLIPTPRPTSCQSMLQKQQQEGLDDFQPSVYPRRRRSSILRRSQTLPAHHGNHTNGSSPHPHDWNGIMNQSVGSPLPSTDDQQLPPKYDSTNN